MRFVAGDKVINRHTKEKYIVISADQGLLLQSENGDVALHCADAFEKQTLNRPDISAIKKSLRTYRE